MNFEAFWSAYPRRVAKLAAQRAWKKAVKQADPALIVASLERQVGAGVFVEPYIPHPATWLNNGRWEDDLPGQTVAGPVVELAGAYRKACRQGNEIAKQSVRARARDAGVAWKAVSEEITRQLEEERA